MTPCACHSTDPYACWSCRYDVEESAVEDDGGPCMCGCHEGEDDEWGYPMAWGGAHLTAALPWGFPTKRRFGTSSRAKRRRARRRADIQLIRKLTRRGVCPCGDHRIDNPGPHLATCRWANEEEGECPL